jgi:hypothetical protein
MGWYELDSPGPGEGSVAGSCEHGKEPSGSIKCWEILERLSDWRLLKKGSTSWSSLVITNLLCRCYLHCREVLKGAKCEFLVMHVL